MNQDYAKVIHNKYKIINEWKYLMSGEKNENTFGN